LFAGIFKQTILNVLTRIKSWISSALDPYTPLLISSINLKSKEKMNQKGYDILDYYFDQITFAVWPRFTEIYDSLSSAFGHPNFTQIIHLENEVTLDVYYSGSLNFLKGLYLCSLYSKDNQMINYRISEMVKTIIKYICAISELEKNPKDKKVQVIKRMNVLYKEAIEPNTISDQDKYTIEKVEEANRRNSTRTSSLWSRNCSLSISLPSLISPKKGRMLKPTPTHRTLRSLRTLAKNLEKPGLIN
jgi:hypothetical protein